MFFIDLIIPKNNNLIAVIPRWGPRFLVKFNLNVLSFGKGYDNIMRFTANEEDIKDGSRIPALFTYGNGQLLHRMSIPGIVNYQYNEFIDSNTWYTIEYIQEFKNNMVS